MTIPKGVTVLLNWLQLLALPLLYFAATGIDRTWQLLCALVFLLALCGARSRWRLPAWLAGAVGFGVLASVGQWALLPMVAVLLGLVAVLGTQTLERQAAASLWLCVAFFAQVLLMQLLQGVTPALLLSAAWLVAMSAVGIWAERLPLWGLALLLVVLGGAGFMLSLVTWWAALIAVVLVALTSSRLLRVQPPLQALVGIALAAIFILARLHG